MSNVQKLFEERKGRYEVEEGICDLRYGEYDGHSSYMDIYNPIWEQFPKYMQEKINN